MSVFYSFSKMAKGGGAPMTEEEKVVRCPACGVPLQGEIVGFFAIKTLKLQVRKEEGRP